MKKQTTEVWVPIIKIQYVHPKLRNFLALNNIPFSKPTTPRSEFLGTTGGVYIVREKNSAKIRLSIYQKRIIPLPPHARYYTNVLTVEAEMIRKGDEFIRKAARLATYEFKKNKRFGFSVD